MARFLFFVASLALFSSIVSAAPVPKLRRQINFPELPYEQFQISSTPGGTAQEEAAAIFLDPFNGVDLTTLDPSVERNIAAMRSAAESAETELFNPAIDAAASEAEADALQVGKTKNKVLKHTAFLQVLRIRLANAQAAGDDTSSLEADIVGRQTKLDSNAAADRANAGKASQAVVGPSPASPAPASPETPSEETPSTETPDAPLPSPSSNPSNTSPTDTSSFPFVEVPYTQFQISSTPGGTAAEEAAALFLEPFEGIDLASLDPSVERALANMRSAAESAEVDLFNPAIEEASGAEADALQVGKIKNKVLKHTIFLQIFNIRLARAQASGDDTSSIEADLADRRAKLATNTALDRENAGQASQAVA
ncbi:hypothetical protein AX16_001270 [Volvariella volvacea WC 439]|nr:hypothetical protein AX16_001270 [Volvariella volvacea WC 439]